MSVRTTLNCQLKDAQFSTFRTLLTENLPNVRGFKGCLSVSVFIDENSSEILLEEEWLSREHHQDYIKFIEDNGVLGELSSFLKTPPIIKYFKKEVI